MNEKRRRERDRQTNTDTDRENTLINHSVQYSIGSSPLFDSGVSPWLGGSLDCGHTEKERCTERIVRV